MSNLTKKALASSLKKLMQNKPISKITVSDIVADCQVGRKTFYYHFQDIYELLAWIFQTELVEELADCKTYDTWPIGVRKIAYFIYDNECFCKNAYYSIGRERAVRFIYPITYTLLIDIINDLPVQIEIEPEYKPYILDYYIYAFIGLIIKWSLSNNKNPEQFISKFTAIMEAHLNKAIEKYSLINRT